MFRFALATFASLLLTAVASAQVVTMPAQVTGAPGQTIIIRPTKVDGGKVQFYFADKAVKDVTASLADPSSVNWRAVQIDKAGVYQVAAYNAKGDVASELAVTQVIIGGVVIDPPVDPPPGVVPATKEDIKAILIAIDKINVTVDGLLKRVKALEDKPAPPPITALAKHITFIGAEKNATARAVNNDTKLRMLFQSAGIAVHVLAADSPGIATAKLTDAVIAAGGTPCVVLQDADGNVLDQGPIQSSSQVENLAAKYIRR